MNSVSKDLPRATPVAKSNSKKNIVLRTATLSDYEQIARLETRHGLAAKTFDQWANLHLHNPFRDPESPIGWVIETGEQEIVGSVGNVPLAYEFEGRKIRAVSGRALAVEPAFRSSSLVLLDRLINQTGSELFVTNAITRASAPSFEVFGCRRVPAGTWDEATFWITRYRDFSKSWLSMKNWPTAAPLTHSLALAAYLRDRVTDRWTGISAAEIQSCLHFDDRFDDFWEALKARHPHLLLAVRSRSVLEWHFKSALSQGRLWIATVADGPRLAAYAIFDRRDNAAYGLKIARLVDFQSLDGTTRLLGPILNWALKRCRDEGIHMMEAVGWRPEHKDSAGKKTAHHRKLSAWTYLYRASSPGLAELLRHSEAWAPSLFDATASL